MTEAIIQKKGKIGRITLNRPHALNALTYKMIVDIEKALLEWEKDISIEAILVDAEGPRAFCAGGDISDLYKQGQIRNFEFGQKFWADEYRLNALIDRYSKPYVVFMQGFTMGGGVGISCHGSHRVVGETSRIAMPECGIGLVPDVGGSFLLTQKSINLGIYLGITCSLMDASDAIFTNFADYFIQEEKWPYIKRQIIKTGDLSILKDQSNIVPVSYLSKKIEIIEEVFSERNLIAVVKRMKKFPEFASSLERLKKASPLSILVTFHMLRMPEISHSVKKALEIEYRFTARAQELTDFQEGIRAMVVDKDKKPIWKHSSLNAITDEEALYLLKPLDKSLDLRL